MSPPRGLIDNHTLATTYLKQAFIAISPLFPSAQVR